jgi:hypothetical protein
MSGFPAVEGDVVEIEEETVLGENRTETVQVDGISPEGFLVLEDTTLGVRERMFPWEGFEAGVYEVVEES